MPVNAELRAQWGEAGYPTDMGSGAVVAPPPSEFVRVYHLTTAEFAINNLALRRIKVARFSDLNDPFELMALNLRERRDRKVLRDFRNAYDSHTGLLCFAADWTDPVLWSHYAAKHRGICLGFDLKRELAQEIRYEDERILASLGESADPSTLEDHLQELLLRTKYRHWQYEKEIRAFVPLSAALSEGPLHFRPYSDDLRLAEVILGPECTASLDAVRDLVQTNETSVIVFKARLAFKFFKVVPDERTVPNSVGR